jgi:hypothetical protein
VLLQKGEVAGPVNLIPLVRDVLGWRELAAEEEEEQRLEQRK